MIRFPNAKINIGLHVTGKRIDGFHSIETIFFPLNWCDALELTASGIGDSLEKRQRAVLSVAGLAISGSNEDNLILRAYRLLDSAFNLPPVNFYLLKKIPMGAGLGGGSSDGAFALTMLNDFFNLGLNPDELKIFAARLGSDCSFFIDNIPSLAEGRGEILQPVKLNLSGFHLLVVKPDVHVSTREAYEDIKPCTPVRPLRELVTLPVSEWSACIKNDFEEGVFQKYPVIKSLKEKLYDMGAVYASMSGSGSAVYGLFREEPLIKNIFDSTAITFRAKIT